MTKDKNRTDETPEIDPRNAAVFLAALPPIDGAIKINGLGDGARLQLDVSRDHFEELLKVSDWGGRILRVVIIPQ